MANPNLIQNLKSARESFDRIDKPKLLRANLGDASHPQLVEAYFNETIRRADLAVAYADSVSDGAVHEIVNTLQDIYSRMSRMVSADNPAYVSQLPGFESVVAQQVALLNTQIAPFLSVAILRSGVLTSSNQAAIQSIVDQAKKDLQAGIDAARETSSKITKEAQELAKSIESKARQAAKRISIEEAQNQFAEASKELRNSVILWTVLSLLSICCFFCFAKYLYDHHPSEPQLASISSKPGEKPDLSTSPLPTERRPDYWWVLVYSTVIRLTILTAIGAVTTFCLKILRAHLHMWQLNKHRQRLANSLAVFVESAETAEQRDLILSQMVNAIASFGNSGLIGGDDDAMSTPKVTIDMIKNITAPK
ncbi:MAG: hypothetical protein ABSA97_13365 [Verrucomicrobiia bacterium]